MTMTAKTLDSDSCEKIRDETWTSLQPEPLVPYGVVGRQGI